MSFNLAFFNGDVRRDKRQEAMLKSMNERDNFLNRLQEMERKRELDEKQEKSARKIQKLWKGHRTKKGVRAELRAHFDCLVQENRDRSLEEVLGMSELIVNFYQDHHDEERLVMTLVELVKARTADRNFEQRIEDSRRLLLARCCIKFLNRATENTIFFHIFRFLEDFVNPRPKLFEAVAGIGLFEAEFHLFEALVGRREGTIEKAAISPRHLQLLSRIFQVFVNPTQKLEVSVKVTDRLLRTMCVVVADDVFTNYVLHYVREHIRPALPNYATFLEATKSVNISLWKVPPPQLESSSIRLRSIFLSQIEHVDRQCEETLKYFFDSLALFLETNDVKSAVAREDLTASGRLRTAANRFLTEHCESMLTSEAFRRSACTYSNMPSINIRTVISLKDYFVLLLDTLSASNIFVEALYNYIDSRADKGEFESGAGKSPASVALFLFCNCLNKRISSVADSDFVPAHIFADFDRVIEFLRDTSIKLLCAMFPNIARSDVYTGNQKERFIRAEMEWKEVTESVFSILGVVYQKDMRIKHFPDGFWTNHGREVLSGLGEQRRMPRRRLGNGRMQVERTVDSEFVERLAGIYESDSDSDDNEEEADAGRDLPVSLRRAICVMKNIPFIVPFMDRIQLFTRLLRREREKYYTENFGGFNETHSLTVRRDHTYMDAYEQFAPRTTRDRVGELKSMVRVKMVNWTGMRESGVDGGGIFREFISDVLKNAFNVERGFFTNTESSLLYPNPTAPFLFGADCLSHFQFIGRMLGKLIYERQLQEVRFAEFFIAQVFESDKNRDIDLQHMKSFDPLIFKHLKDLLKLGERELEDLQLDFSVVTSDMGLVRSINLKPNGAMCRVNLDNVHEYVRLYVNHHLKLRIAPMVDALRKGISEVISIEWLRMFGPHELQILVAGHEGVFSASEMRRYTEVRFSRGTPDEQYVEMFWDVVDKLSSEDKRALLRFITGCSRPPIDGFKSISPSMGILVSVTSSDDQLPTSATCMNLLTVPRYSSRSKLEEKLRYAINSGAGFELA